VHIQTHILSGWCVGNCFRLAPRERLMCMLAAGLADLDGLSILGGQTAYETYHHTLAHNLIFAVVCSFMLAAFSPHRVKALLIYLALMHLHLVMDLLGSGTDWDIRYFWPFSDHATKIAFGWDFYSWQNILAAYSLVALTVLIANRAGRTPLEVLMPSLDRQLVGLVRRKRR
jgi:hypothetical protein